MMHTVRNSSQLILLVNMLTREGQYRVCSSEKRYKQMSTSMSYVLCPNMLLLACSHATPLSTLTRRRAGPL